MFGEEITDYDVFSNGYVERQGFVFVRGTGPKNIFDVLFVNNTPDLKKSHRKHPESIRTLEEHIQFISENNIEKVRIVTGDLNILKSMPCVKYLHIILTKDEVDYFPLYEMPEILSLNIERDDFEPLSKPVDYSKIKGLLDLGASAKEGVNFEKISTIKSLWLTDWMKKDLKVFVGGKQLDSLCLIQCKMHSLDGIEKSEKMQCLYLHYNRSLRDINALVKVKKTLRALRIENCPKIEDFSVLAELENLELLELTGKNTLPNLQFIKQLKNLKTFIFDMNVLDGDLTPCLGLTYVYSRKNRKHYNVKDKDMPKGKYVRGNEDIEIWRRME